jgi:hypothetical protein
MFLLLCGKLPFDGFFCCNDGNINYVNNTIFIYIEKTIMKTNYIIENKKKLKKKKK